MNIIKLNEDNIVEVYASYSSEDDNIIYSFTHETGVDNSVYALFINEIEIPYNKIYSNESKQLIDSLLPNKEYYIINSDFEFVNPLKIEIILVNAEIILSGFDDFDGIYDYINYNYYVNIDNYYTLTKSLINNKYYWIISNENDIEQYMSETTLHSTHPAYHEHTSVSHDDNIISTINIEGGQLKINYTSTYDQLVNS
jgi:hypothetical protein